MMKKMMCMVLCVVLALGLTVSVYAAQSGPLSVAAEPASASSTELTIRVRLTAPVTDGVFRLQYDTAQLTLLGVTAPDPDAAEINGPAGVQGLSAGADLPAGQIKTAFVFDETGVSGDTVLECRFQMIGAVREFTFTVDSGVLYRDGQTVSCPDTSVKVRLSDGRVDPGTPSHPATPDQPSDPGKRFDDVKQGDWFYEAVTDMAGKGYISGVSDRLFGPNQSLSRAMLVTILYRMDGEKAVAGTGAFTDVVRGSWYEKAVNWASANGIAQGYNDGRFGPDDPVTRQQMAAILWRYAQYQGLDVTAGGTAMPAFADRDQIAAWAEEAMTWAYSRGIMVGKSATQLDPEGGATRAEAAAMLYRFGQLSAKK